MTNGRPTFKPPARLRRRVAELVAAATSQDEIATAIDVAPKTLRKHFRAELDSGRRKSKVTLSPCVTPKQDTPLDYMLAVMNDTTTDPARRDRMAIAAAPYLHARLGDMSLGKKQQAKVDAELAGKGTAWEDLLHPQPTAEAAECQLTVLRVHQTSAWPSATGDDRWMARHCRAVDRGSGRRPDERTMSRVG